MEKLYKIMIMIFKTTMVITVFFFGVAIGGALSEYWVVASLAIAVITMSIGMFSLLLGEYFGKKAEDHYI